MDWLPGLITFLNGSMQPMANIMLKIMEFFGKYVGAGN